MLYHEYNFQRWRKLLVYLWYAQIFIIICLIWFSSSNIQGLHSEKISVCLKLDILCCVHHVLNLILVSANLSNLKLWFWDCTFNKLHQWNQMKTSKQLYRIHHEENMFEVDSCRLIEMREICKAKIWFIWKVHS